MYYIHVEELVILSLNNLFEISFLKLQIPKHLVTCQGLQRSTYSI